MQNTLLIQAIPYEDESPISFLLRTAKLNAHSSISNLIGKENYQSIIKASLNYHLADEARFSLVLSALNIDSNYSLLAFERSKPTHTFETNSYMYPALVFAFQIMYKVTNCGSLSCMEKYLN